jgi:hypothetical protein
MYHIIPWTFKCQNSSKRHSSKLDNPTHRHTMFSVFKRSGLIHFPIFKSIKSKIITIFITYQLPVQITLKTLIICYFIVYSLANISIFQTAAVVVGCCFIQFTKHQIWKREKTTKHNYYDCWLLVEAFWNNTTNYINHYDLNYNFFSIWLWMLLHQKLVLCSRFGTNQKR